MTVTIDDLVQRGTAGVSPPPPGSVRCRDIETPGGVGSLRCPPAAESVVRWCVDAVGHDGVHVPRVAVLSAGAGVLALALAHELADPEIHAVETDLEVFSGMQRNADARVAVGDPPVLLHLADVDGLPASFDATFDLVVATAACVTDAESEKLGPPTCEHGSRPAGEGGAGEGGAGEGDALHALERAAARLCKPGGLAVVEHSDRHGLIAPAVFGATTRWTQIQVRVNQGGHGRFLTVRRAHHARPPGSGAATTGRATSAARVLGGG